MSICIINKGGHLNMDATFFTWYLFILSAALIKIKKIIMKKGRMIQLKMLTQV